MGLENARSFQMHLPGLLRLPLETPPLCRLALVRRDFLLRLCHRSLLGRTPLLDLRPTLPTPPPARRNPNLAALLHQDRLTRQGPPPKLWRVLLEIDHQFCGQKIA